MRAHTHGHTSSSECPSVEPNSTRKKGLCPKLYGLKIMVNTNVTEFMRRPRAHQYKKKNPVITLYVITLINPG